jgi:recombination protein RecA
MALKLKKESENEKEELNSIDALIRLAEKQHGAGCIRRLGDSTPVQVEVFTTGSYLLDRALGIMGYPRGRIVEVYGPESSGKTTLALHAIAECQKVGGCAAFIDAEHALDLTYAKNLGVDTANLLVSQPDCGEQALELLDLLIKSKKISIAVIDSVAALVPKAELEGEMGDSHMGLQARLMSQAMRKLAASVSQTNTCVIFINQVRQKINAYGYGDPTVTAGGNALKFYASVRLEIKRIGSVKEGEESVGNKVSIKVVKNKLAPPFKKIETEIVFGKGLNKVGEVLDIAESLEVIQKAGAWYSYGDTKFQGRQAGFDLFSNNKELFDRLLADINLEKNSVV